MKSINPYNNQVVFNHKELTKKQVESSIEKVNAAFIKWRNSSFNNRKKLFMNLAKVLENNKNKYAEIMTLEMGKPISQSIAEVEKCAWVCSYYAENGAEFLAPKKIKTEAYNSYVRYDSMGVILGIMPWNYPFWQVFRFAVPTIMAGNTALLKHASNVMQSAKMIQEAFIEAGFDENVFQTLIIGSDKVENIIRHPFVKGVSLTGSKPAGAKVSATASEEIKPSLLELGGNNALVVFDDCDQEKTLETIVNARFQNTGQSCIAGKRLLLQKSIANDFIEKLIKKIIKLKSGNPLDKDTFIGTMVNNEAAKELANQLDDAIKKGGEVVIGGNHHGAYFEPTLVTNVSQEMRIFSEETFGPLLACTTFDTEEEALKLINLSQFGLGTSLFTKNKKRIEEMIPKIDDGAVFINELVKSDPRLPFGGTKISGFGRELSIEGIRSFVNVKTVYINNL